MPYFMVLLALLVPQQDFATRATHWKEDLAFFADNFKTKHVKPFTKITEADFDQALKEIDPEKLTDQQIVVKLWQLLARVGDSHSSLNPPRTMTFRQYPIAVIYLSDGWYIFGIHQQYPHALEGKLIRIGTTPIAEVEKKLKTLAADVNVSYGISQIQQYIALAETLQALGIISETKTTDFTYVNAEGKETTIALNLVQLPRQQWKLGIKPEAWPDHLRPARAQHGYVWLENSTVLYVWYDRCSEFSTYPIKKWTQDVLEQIAEKKPRKVIVDLRRNGGGNSVLLEPLINSLAKNEINDKEKLFVLIGPATFSSAMMNAQHFKTRTKATFVGEPTGGSPNHFGEVRTFTLPHSKCVVQFSTKQFKMTSDNATTIEPHLEIKQTARGFFADKDEVLEAVIKK